METIFTISTQEEFLFHCLENFHYQYENVEVYRNFVDYLNINPIHVTDIEQIPFLPIELFKNHKILDKNAQTDRYFQSSGTTQSLLSKHWIVDENLYQESIYQSFEQFTGKPEDFCFSRFIAQLFRKSALVFGLYG